MKDYVTTCDIYFRFKISGHCSLDLSKFKFFYLIFAVLDSLTNIRHFVTCNKFITSKKCHNFFLIFCTNIMYFPTISFCIVIYNANPSFGNLCSRSYK